MLPAVRFPAGGGATTTVLAIEVAEQPLTALVTVKLPAVLTVILCVVAPVLQVLPEVELAVRITLEPWQRVGDTFVEIVGTAGIAFGAATALLVGLLQLSNVCLTV